MTYREAFTALIQILGELYSDQASIRRIIIQVNLPIEQILFSGRADNTWADVLYKARRHDKVEGIFAVVLGEYSAVAELHTAVAGYREAVARGDVPPPSLRRCDFYAHVSLPPNFVARPALLHEVRDMVLSTPSIALTSAIPMDALHGMGGIGKSVMARALCDDPEVQDAFSDGILWATIGQTPELIPRLREWVEELGGIIPQTAPTINQLKQNLAELLTDRACLLVLDDVWHRIDAEPFLVGGPRCRLLLTTRDSEVARGLGAGVHPVPAMDPDEALILLDQWAGGVVRQTDEAVKRQIVRRLGYLPLAIKLAGSQLQRKSPDRWLANFDATQLRERRMDTVHDSLATTFELSLGLLELTDRRLYTTLAVFRQGEAIYVQGIVRLWTGLAEYTEEQAADLVYDLASRALLQITNGAADGLPVAVTIHDLLRDFMAAELGEAGRLAAHRALLEAYRQTQVGAGWATAPDDGYLYDHLVYHLDQIADHEASAVTELQSLFANDAWLQVRESGAGYQYDGYLADLEVTWWRAHQETLQQIEAGEQPVAFAECMRYALIRTSVNSLASNYEPALVARAIETGLWSVQRAFSVALKIPDPLAQVWMLTAILTVDGLPPELRTLMVQAGLAATLTMEDEGSRAEALAVLALHLSRDGKAQALTQGLTVALAIKNETFRAAALAGLAPHLSGRNKAQALTQGLAAASAIESKESRAQVLAALAPHLSGDDKAQALMQGFTAAVAIEWEVNRAAALAALAPHLLGDDKAQALTQGLAATLVIEDEWFRAQALAALAPNLSGELLTQALTATLAIEDEGHRVCALAALAPNLSGELLAQALAATLAIEDEGIRAEALAALALYLSGEDKAQALTQGLAAALAIEYEQPRAQALAALAPHLPGEDKARALGQGLFAALAITNRVYRTRALVALAPHLSGDLLMQALAAAQAITDEEFRTKVLIVLAPHLLGEDKVQALAQGLAAAFAITYDKDSSEAAMPISYHWTGKQLGQYLTSSQKYEDDQYRAWALAELAPHLPGDLLAQGLAAALAIRQKEFRAEALTALALHLSGEDKAQALTQALAAALAIVGHPYRVQTLASLAPQLSGEQKALALAQGLAAAQAIEDEYVRAEALADLALHLSGEDRARALAQGLTDALAVDDENFRANALIALAPQLTGEDKAQALAQGLAAALAIQDDGSRAEALAALAPQLSGEDKAQALAQGLAVALAIQDERSRAQALATLAPQLSGVLFAQGLAAALAIRDEQYRTEALAALAPQLSGVLLAQGLAAALAIEDERYRIEALSALTVLTPLSEEKEPLLREIHTAMVHHLWNNMKHQERRDLLSLLSDSNWLSSPIFDTNTLSNITAHIIEICWHWTWL